MHIPWRHVRSDKILMILEKGKKMLKHTQKIIKRALAMVLCAMLLLGAVPLDILPRASAASWADPYMDQLKQNGVMVGGRPNDRITRAEMAAVLNRAFGFRRTGPIPFTDVHKSAWYYNDIVVSYNEGILSGTSRTTASPKAAVTREQALALIGRCLRYQENAGEVTDFTDGKNFSNWSSIYVRSALLAGIINSTGGNFRPKSAATRGEIAVMLSTAMGKLVSSSGVTELGGVFGNVTVNAPNVTLRNTTIAGDLYLTGGVGLGNVILDNVKVLGRIIVAGGGEGESGEASVLLNNVTAHQMVVDPATGQYVSIRALGNTDISETLVRSDAYIQDDVRNNNMGLRKVIFEEPAEGHFTIAGNMKDVTVKAPGSLLTVGDTGTGSVTKITVDEEATDARLNLEINASVDDIKLDTSSTITGTGDIGHIDVGANGCTSEILPDTITVRPGVITEVGGITNVDSEKAKELSENPRLLAGYPKAKNIAPTSADAYFSTNKPGTLYWALTDAARGPLTDADVETLIEQPSYGSGFKQKGTIEVESSKTEYVLPLEGLTQGGRYYISAALVDAHERRSPVKSQRIETPDGTVPAMASKDYPSITDATPTRNEENAGLPFSDIANLQATVMANKSCDLYYVLLAAGSTAPSTGELLSAAFPNPYGYGRLHLIKNTLDSFKITEIDMDLDGTPDGLGDVKENTSYDLYYWLTDANGEQSSQVQKISVTTKDVTPPEFTMGEMFQSDTKATSVTLSNTVNEDATVYWVAVPSGDPYPKRDPEVYPNTDEWREFLKTETAKIQVAAGVGTSKSQSGKLNAKANTQFNITISRLEKESAYDVYYLAQDSANNYSQVIGMYTAHTLDETPPSAEMRFESFPAESPETPYAYSTIDVVFSEAIRYRQPSSAPVKYSELRMMELYTKYKNASPADKAKAEEEFVGALRDTIILCDSTGQAVPERTADSGSAPWVVDYRNVQVLQDGKDMVVSFVNDPSDLSKSALNLESGASYYFHLQNITDDSQSRNQMGDQDMKAFTTVSARVGISRLEDLELKAYALSDDGESIDTTKPISVYNDITVRDEKTITDVIPIDIGFTATPESTGNSADGVMWDMLFWFNTDVEFDLFTRVNSADGAGEWVPVGDVEIDSNGANTVAKRVSIIVPSNKRKYTGASVVKTMSNTAVPQYRPINAEYKLGMIGGGFNDGEPRSYDFALHFTKVGTRTDRASLNQRIEGQVTFVTGGASSLNSITPSNINAYDNVVAGTNGVTDITWPNRPGDTEEEPRLLWTQFQDGRAPVMQDSFPALTPTSNGVNAVFTMTSPGTVYYVMAPLSNEGYTLNPQRNEGGTSVRVPLSELQEKVPYCNKSGPVALNGHKYTMASDLSVFDRMFPNETVPDDYKFDFPISSNITNPSSSDIASNRLVASSVQVSRADEDHFLPNLEPNTEYLMYLVTTTGTSGVYSPVTVYRFRTKEITQPVLWTQASNTTATINSDMDATVAYKLFPYDRTNLPLALSQTFSTAGLTSAFNEYRDRRSTWKTSGSGFMEFSNPDFTVLDAMIETITSGRDRQGSLFDLCADESLKQSVQEAIESVGGGGSGAIGSDVNQSVSASSPLSVDCEKWKELGDVNYCLAVCGYSGTSTNPSGYAFTAAYPIIKQKEKVKVTVNSNLDYTPPATGVAGGGTIDGSITLTFTEALYAYTSSSGGMPTRTPLDAAPITGRPQPSAYQSIGSYFPNTNPQISLALNQTVGTPLRSVRINFDGVSLRNPTTRITLDFSGQFSGASSDPQNNPLSITVRATDPANSSEVTVTVNDPDNWLAAPIE